ncbi:MAG: nhaA [Gammaproteobacteria bacterium]|jgi:NhaA family Na+:H+ antiporter|nr:nhaA [Gammaproteobacteria bacterium]
MPIKTLRKFIKLEAASGIILLFFAILALILDNSPFYHYYEMVLDAPFAIQFGTFSLAKPVLTWINDGLMALFFLLVGLEIKREMLEGELNSIPKMVLPGIAALGGMLLPAFIYAAFNWHNPDYLRGWAIPTATDIAFSLGLLALLGSRFSGALKVFLTALAILDDLGAIIVIAIFYTADLSWLALGLAGICLALLFLLNRLGVTSLTPYGLVGFVLWVCVLKSGVHATLAGVALALAIPCKTSKNQNFSPLRKLEHHLHPWIAFGVLPLFAFANAGINFKGTTPAMLIHSIPLGITCGLLFGKQLGVFGACWLAVKAKIAKLPDGISWKQLYGVAALCGIGFTMSLFIGTLAFDETANLDYARLVRIGVFSGSILSGVCGYLVLSLVSKNKS